MSLIEDLQWRGMLQDIMPGTAEQLLKEPTFGYIGFDPSAESLHIGSLVPILLLMHLQKAGHHPIALVGGATGMVGDPSGKSEERNLLDADTLYKNIKGIKKQLEQFLDFDPSRENPALVVNNYDWFGQITFLDFIRDTGKHITVNYMMAKDSVKKRLEGSAGMSFTEFTYQLVQGYDFYWLYSHMNCKLQMGGSDQWGNITTGAELIRRKTGGEAFAFTCPLITKADGGKFGKTEKGNVWLDADKTTPFQFYQFWLNASDVDTAKWIKIFTFLNKQEIAELLENHFVRPEERGLQKALAKEITTLVHGEHEWKKATEQTDKLFANLAAPAESLTEADLLSLDGIVRSPFSADRIKQGINVISLLAESGIFSSKGEARKMVQNGGISINRSKVENQTMVVNNELLLHGKFILVQRGKKNYYLVEAV